MATVMSAPKSKPQKSGLAMSPRSVPNAYLNAAMKEKLFLLLFDVLQQLPSPVPQDSSCDFVLRADIESAPTGLNVENDVVGVDSISILIIVLVTELVEVSLSKILVNTPATIAIIIEVITR